MLQDTISIQTSRAALPYPPPAPFPLTRVFGYGATAANLAAYSGGGKHSLRSKEHWKLCVAVMRSFIVKVADVPKFPDDRHLHDVLPFVGVFGPAFVCR